MFDWEDGIALHAMQVNRASFPSKGDVSYDFSSCSKHLGVYTRVTAGMAIRNSTLFSEVKTPA